ncbi:MAG: peptidoglycan editing factor PgeF [Faecalimonas sp.]|nr:peptidoglycan editing factor PgeF [Faecalimonas sp.]
MNYKSQEKILEERQVGELLYLSYPLLENTGIVKHGFSTRIGGVSKAHLGSMNLSFTRGDEEAAVRENYRRMAGALDVEEDSFVCSQQTHTTNVRKVSVADKGKGLVKPLDYTDVDGLITDVPGLTLTTFYADCVPLYFVDPVHKAIGLSHSGWRGTVGKMGALTLQRMKEEYGTHPADVYAAIGPSICRDCYEVSEDVIAEFQKQFAEELWPLLYDEKKNGKYQLDLWKANELILLEAGVPRKQIAVTNLCTCCNAETLFSHRASQGRRGNLAAFLALR